MQNHQTTMTTRCRATTRHLCIQLLVALICFTTYVHARSAYDEISNNPALTKLMFSDCIEFGNTNQQDLIYSIISLDWMVGLVI
ncbi:hypothetical protein BLOT_002513 [Blomia tropicalis]|nr:hypothetical protein BLOT_002513 [Blomia tropicalis]